MKIFKIIIGIVVVIVGLFFAYLATLPDSYRVERSTVINASDQLVMEHLANFKKWEKWSPWIEKDPNCKYTYEGPEFGVGAKMNWDGNDSVGIGGMTITAMEGNSSVSYDLKFIAPWDMASNGAFMLSPDEGGTKVVWVDEGDLPFFMRMMGGMMDAMIGPDFERGLSRLKDHVEMEAEEAIPDLSVEEVMVESFTYISTVDSCAVKDMFATFENAFNVLGAYIEENKVEPKGSSFAIYHKWDGENTTFEAGFPVSETGNGNELVGSGQFYSGNAAKTIFKGPYEGTPNAHNAISAYIESNEKEIVGAPWEVYIVGPGDDPEPNNWVTEVYYPIK